MREAAAVAYAERCARRLRFLWRHAEPHVRSGDHANVAFPRMRRIEYPDDWRIFVELRRVQWRFEDAVTAIHGYSMLGVDRAHDVVAREWRDEVRQQVRAFVGAVKGVPGFYLPWHRIRRDPFDAAVRPLEEMLDATP